MTATSKRQPPAAPTVQEPVEGGYRCAECDHWRNLRAYAPANVYGPLGADGQLEYYYDIDDYEVHEASIQCTEHPAAHVEKLVKGIWCRWWQCEKCRGTGRVRVGENYKAPDGYTCSAGVQVPSKYGPWTRHAGWRPVADPAA